MKNQNKKKSFPPEPFYGDKCPFCGNDAELNYSAYEFEEWNVWQDVTCEKCGAGWTNHYDFHYVMSDNFTDPQGNEVKTK